MFNLQKAGGVAALFDALGYVVGFVLMATLLNPGNTEGWGAAQKLTFVLERKSVYQSLYICIAFAWSVGLVVLTVALHEQMKDKAADWMKIATPFGFIWAGLVLASGMVANVGLEKLAAVYARDAAQAVSAWTAIGVVQDGLGGGIELVGGVWVLLISAAAFRFAVFPKPLIYLGFVVGVAGILTAIPMFMELTAVFGLAQIPWFVWIAIVMLRSR